MIFFLNRGLILEQEIVRAIKTYFTLTGVPEYYKNFTVSVTNQHPFARMLLSDSPEKDAASLFPVVVVAAEDDGKPPDLTNLVDTQTLIIEPEDIRKKEDGGPSEIEARYTMMTPGKMGELRAAMEAREDRRIFGATLFIRRRDHIGIDIWAENPQLKNELYELIRLFVCGFMRDYLAKLYKEHFRELDENGESPLVIFDSSVRGQRSNNFNVDFGVELSGGHIAFDADYIIEQSVVDTELVGINDDLILEVINHVRHYEETTRERIIGPADSAGGGEAGGTSGNDPGGSGGNADEAGPNPSPETAG